MALPAIDELCRAIDRFPESNFCITFPGGAEVCALSEKLPPSLYSMARGALAQANAALVPLTPLFDVIEAIAAIQKCLTAFVDALGPPPDPSKVADCIPNLAKRIEKLLALLPPASVLLMVVQLLDVLIGILEGTILELNAVQLLLERISRAQLLSSQVPSLLAVIDCGQQSAAASMDNVARAFASINPIISVINAVGGLAGLEPIPPFEGLSVEGPEQAIDALRAVVDVLRTLRSSIPV